MNNVRRSPSVSTSSTLHTIAWNFDDRFSALYVQSLKQTSGLNKGEIFNPKMRRSERNGIEREKKRVLLFCPPVKSSRPTSSIYISLERSYFFDLDEIDACIGKNEKKKRAV